jgi:hypothetical protein
MNQIRTYFNQIRTHFFNSVVANHPPSLTSRQVVQGRNNEIEQGKLPLVLASTVSIGFECRWDSWPYYSFFPVLLLVLKRGLFFSERKGLTIGHSLLRRRFSASLKWRSKSPLVLPSFHYILCVWKTPRSTSSITACIFVAAGTCSASCCQPTSGRGNTRTHR